MNSASNELRFKNHLIDSVICSLLVFLFYAIAVMLIDFSNKDEIFLRYFIFFFLVVRTIYCTVFEFYFFRTIGKAVTKTKVVTEEGGYPGFQKIFLRSICRLIPFNEFSFLFGTGWHDSISKTMVVKDN